MREFSQLPLEFASTTMCDSLSRSTTCQTHFKTRFILLAEFFYAELCMIHIVIYIYIYILHVYIILLFDAVTSIPFLVYCVKL